METIYWVVLAGLALLVLRQVWMRRGVVQLPAGDLQRRLDAREKLQIVDVREPSEYQSGHIPGAHSVPLSSLGAGLSKLDQSAETVLVCASGNRSLVAYHRLKARGFTSLYNIPGGMMAWKGPVRRK